jgi:hypothetical protein
MGLRYYVSFVFPVVNRENFVFYSVDICFTVCIRISGAGSDKRERLARAGFAYILYTILYLIIATTVASKLRSPDLLKVSLHLLQK